MDIANGTVYRDNWEGSDIKNMRRHWRIIFLDNMAVHFYNFAQVQWSLAEQIWKLRKSSLALLLHVTGSEKVIAN